MILGEVVEGAAGKNRQLDVGLGDERGGGGDGAVAAGNQDSLRSALDCLLDPLSSLLRLDRLEVEPRFRRALPARLSALPHGALRKALRVGGVEGEAGMARRREARREREGETAILYTRKTPTQIGRRLSS